MRKGIKERRWDFIIGDDASGRIPALVIWKTIRKIYEQENKKRKSCPLPLIFVAGGRPTEKRKELIKKRLEKLIKQGEIRPNQRVLIVTEFIKTGQSLVSLLQALEELGIQYDIAALKGSLIIKTRSQRMHSFLKKFLKETETQIWLGEIGYPGLLYGDYALAGVKKASRDDVLSRPSHRAKRSGIREEYRRRTIKARKDAERRANYLRDYYYYLNQPNPIPDKPSRQLEFPPL